MQTLEDSQTLFDNRVTFFAFDVRNKADAAGVVLVRGVIQPLFRRQGTVTHLANLFYSG